MTTTLIVGAGPAGLILACDLARRNIPFRLVERRTEPMHASKGKGLQPRTLEVFDDLGLVDAVLADGRPYPPIRFHQGDTTTDRVMFEQSPVTPATPYPNLIMLPQWRTEQLLRARLAALGGAVDWGTALVALTQDETGVTATLAGPHGTETVRADYLVGADGGHSAVRKLAGIALDGESPDLPGMIVADMTVTNLDRSVWHAWGSAPTDMLTLCPLTATDAFQLTASLPQDREAATDRAGLQALVERATGRDDIVLGEPSWVSAFRPNLRMAERFRAGRVFILGDAAHVHPPTGGQGLNTAVQDAYNLGWKLAARLAGGGDDLLDTYEEERLPVAATVLGHSDLLYRRGLAGDAAAMRRGDDEKQLRLNYRGASLSLGAAPAALAPGDRMPDRPLTLDGRPTTLFAAMRGPHWTVLDRTGAFRGDAAVLPMPDDPDFAGLSQVLIRPDGYIGLMATGTAEAEAYLGRL